MSKKTHFGFKEVDEKNKASLVANVFHSVADSYNLMNDVMSFGAHRLWKKFTIKKANLRKGHVVLDVAAGTGDLSFAMAKIVGDTGHVYMSDINESMLAVGKDNMIDRGILGNVSYVQADAQNLPFPDNHFDCITIGFGLRNVTQKDLALKSFYRVLKPGGKLLILEFSKPSTNLLRKFYDAYSFHVIPKLGKVFANDSESYQYLVESIRMHPDQETLKNMMETAEFEDVCYHNLTGGIVALHIGYKY